MLEKIYPKFLSNICNKNNMFERYKVEIDKNANIPENKKGNILITSICSSDATNLFEGLYARKAILEGNEVYVLFCGQFLNNCETKGRYLKINSLRCSFCKKRQEQFVSAFGVNPCYYDHILDKDDINKINKLVNDYFVNNKHVFCGVNIDTILYTSLQRHYLEADPKIKNDKITRGFLFTIYSTLIAMQKLCSQIKPKYVMSTHGTYSTWGSTVEYCKANGIRVVTYGRTYNKGGIIFAIDDSYLLRYQNIKDEEWNSRILSDKQLALVHNFYQTRLGIIDGDITFDYNNGNNKLMSKKEICKLLKLDDNKKIVTLLPNIPWDGQFNGNSHVYKLFRDWLRETIEFFAKKEDVYLIIRSHPAEMTRNAGHETTITMISDMFSKLGSNIIVLEPDSNINSFGLSNISEFVLTYSTTTTLEVAYLKKPVLLVGNPAFKNKGIVYDINSREQYFNMIDNGLENGLEVTEAQYEKLLTFSYYYFFEVVMPETLLDIKDTVQYRFKFNNEMELKNNKELDYLYDCIENDKKINFDKFYTK